MAGRGRDGMSGLAVLLEGCVSRPVDDCYYWRRTRDSGDATADWR